MSCSCGPGSSSLHPISGGFLSGQNEATGTRARELHQPRRDMLAAPSLGIDQDGHRLQEGRGLHRPLAVVRMPSVEELDDLTAVRIVGFDAARQDRDNQAPEVGHGGRTTGAGARKFFEPTIRYAVISWAETWALILANVYSQKFVDSKQILAMVGAVGIEPTTSPV
jgi:hypothetical protein